MNKNSLHHKINKKLREAIKKYYPSVKPNEQRFILNSFRKLKRDRKLSEKDFLAFINSDKVIHELKMMERKQDSSKIIIHLTMKFSHDLQKMLGDDETLYNDAEKKFIPHFTTGEKIDIIEGFINIVKMRLENIYGEKVEEEHLKLEQKFRDRFRFSIGFGYFNRDAVQLKCVGNGEWDFYTIEEFNALPGAEAQWLSENELKNLLKSILHILKRERSCLLRHPNIEKKENQISGLEEDDDELSINSLTNDTIALFFVLLSRHGMIHKFRNATEFAGIIAKLTNRIKIKKLADFLGQDAEKKFFAKKNTTIVKKKIAQLTNILDAISSYLKNQATQLE